MKPKTYKILCNFVLLSLLLFSGVLISSESDSPIKKEVIKIGCLFPLTGLGGLYGRDSVEAIKIAQKDIRENWPHSNFDFEVIIGDTRSKPLRGVQIARNFIVNENVNFLCGVVNSSIALSVTEIAKKEDVFFIGTDHASPRLVSEALHPSYFRMSNDTRQSMQAGAIYINTYHQKKKKLKIAFIGPDYDYGYQAWSDLRFFLKKENVDFEIVGEFWPKLFASDYTIYISALIDRKPDIVINGQWGQDFIAFIRQAKQFDLFNETTLMNFDAGGNYETFSTLGEDMPLGLVLSARHHVNWPETNSNFTFVNRFQRSAGRYPSYAAEGAYSGIIAIAKAVNLSGGIEDKEVLRDNFKNLVINLPEDPDGFMSTMDPESHQILQAQAIGITMKNSSYPPAKVMLGNWFVHFPSGEWPSTIPESTSLKPRKLGR
ncbi:MAG: branched-chain amino acid transport system substrate-binding protein [Candidatus Endobugula sp.]|jgi:branched-chain amino acid transport system substrate-binding protein